MADTFLMGQSGGGGGNGPNIISGTATINSHTATAIGSSYDDYYDEQNNIYNITDTFVITHTNKINTLYIEFNIGNYETCYNDDYYWYNNGLKQVGVLITSNLSNKKFYTQNSMMGRSRYKSVNYEGKFKQITDTASGYGYTEYLTPLVRLTTSGIGTTTVTLNFYIDNFLNTSSNNAFVGSFPYKIIE